MMTWRTGLTLNEFLIYFALMIWSVLVILFVVGIIKKDHFALKKIGLYALNSSLFFLGAIFYTRLALITGGPKEATMQASLMVLKNKCLIEFLIYISISLVVTVVFVALNRMYVKFILKKVDSRFLFFLGITDFALLVILSFSTVLNYYLAIYDEINSFYR